jgi:hypothetical protein
MYTNNNPMPFIDHKGLKYTKTITAYNIQINASIAVFGAASSSAGWNLVRIWRKGILDTWHKRGTRRYRGSRLTNLIGKSITFNIRMSYDPTASAHWQATKNGIQNSVKVMPRGFRSNVNAIGGWQGNWAASDGGWVAAHEFGHMIGLGDHYSLSNPTNPCSGHRGHLMGQFWGVLQQHELDDMIDLRPGRSCR